MEIHNLEHKHLLVNATFKDTPFKCNDFVCEWIENLVETIGMEILLPPRSARSEEKGNEGISAFCIITTSHICLHSWEKTDPNLVQLDVYSCKDFDHFLVLKELKEFNPLFLGCRFHDRAVENSQGWEMGREGLF